MRSEGLNFAQLRFSTSTLPMRARLPAWREFARQLVCVDIEPLSDQPFECEATLRALPELRVLSWASSASRLDRSSEAVARGGDTLGLVINRSGTMAALQRGQEVSLSMGDAALMLHSKPAALMQSQSRGVGLVLPRAALASLVPDIEDAAIRPVPHTNEALRLLMSYLKAVWENPALERPELQHLVTTHVRDLVAAIIGTGRDGAAIAEKRGVAAARLAAIKADIIRHAGHPALTLLAVAERQGVTPRTIQRLFESEGATFSAFVLGQRLARAQRMLADERCTAWTIGAIAFAAGFGDLSYFHRVFRRRYGATPSETRADST
jgi:AraC-like DNA-binding protein